MKTKIIGIDFGTTKSGIAVVSTKNQIEVLTSNGETATPETPFEEWALPSQVIISPAEEDGKLNFKCLTFASRYKLKPAERVQNSIPFRLPKLLLGEEHLKIDKKTAKRLHVDGRFLKIVERLRPAGLSAYIIRQLLDRVNLYLEERPEQGHTLAVIGTPADFDYKKKRALEYAAQIANIDEVYFIEEPLAALLSFKEKLRSKKPEQKVLIIDYGGGTCNYAVSVLSKDGIQRIHANKVDQGGKDITETLLSEAVEITKGQGKVKFDDLKNEQDQEAVRIRIDGFKIDVSTGYVIPNGEIFAAPYIDLIGSGRDSINISIQNNFAECIQNRIEEVKNIIRADLESAPNPYLIDVDAVVFLGESRHLRSFSKIFWVDWLEQATNGAQQHNLEVENLAQELWDDSPQAVTRGCACYARYLHKSRAFSISSRETPYKILNPSAITVEILDDSHNGVLHYEPKGGAFNQKLLVKKGCELPQTITITFQIIDKIDKFSVRFLAKGEELETFTFSPKPESCFRSIPAGAEITITYTIRIDQLIEIRAQGLSSAYELLGSFKRRLLKQSRSDEPPLKLDIPIVCEGTYSKSKIEREKDTSIYIRNR